MRIISGNNLQVKDLKHATTALPRYTFVKFGLVSGWILVLISLERRNDDNS